MLYSLWNWDKCQTNKQDYNVKESGKTAPDLSVYLDLRQMLMGSTLSWDPPITLLTQPAPPKKKKRKENTTSMEIMVLGRTTNTR